MSNIYIKTQYGNITIPILPENMPEIISPGRNTEFETYNNGVFNVSTGRSLKEFTLDVILPSHRYSFAKSTAKPQSIINILKKSFENQKAVRVIMIGKITSNILCLMENLKYSENRQGDINLSIDFKEYRGY